MYLQLVYFFSRIQVKSLAESTTSNYIVMVQTIISQEYQHVMRCMLSDQNESTAWITGEKIIWMTMPVALFIVAGIIATIVISV